MKIAFINLTPLIYTVETPYSTPLGGSESAMCYLAEALAQKGHEVTLFSRIQKVKKIHGVMHLPDEQIYHALDLDFVIVQNTPSCGKDIRPFLRSKTKLILWLQHAHDQPAAQCLQDPSIVNAYSAIICISQWQKSCFLAHFHLDTRSCFILRNAISPLFENMFFPGEKIRLKKIHPPILAYTSTPFRGLDLLLKIFPTIRQSFPDVTLHVFSSMKVYQVDSEADEANFGRLYELCRQTSGVELIGSLPQSQLVHRLKPISILAYPNTFPETGCTSIIEAMSAGCEIITSNLGALPETTSGFGTCVNIGSNKNEFLHSFTQALINKLQTYYSPDARDLDSLLAKQVYFVNHAYTWKRRAEEWEHFLLKMC